MSIKISGVNVIDNGRNISGVAVTASTECDLPNGTVAERPTSASSGSTRYNSETGVLEFYDGSNWIIPALSDYLPYTSDRGVFGRGFTPTITTTNMDYINISSIGNALFFGNFDNVSRDYTASCSNSSRGVWGGGTVSPGAYFGLSSIIYNMQSGGDFIGMGTLDSETYQAAGCSNSTRGLFGGGFNPTLTNTIHYFTITSTGDTTDFGDLTVSRTLLSSCSSPTRGLFGGGGTPISTNTIDYVTIASTGDATDFGDLTVARNNLASCSSPTRGLFAGGLGGNVIDYVTIASTGDATDFGDLTSARTSLTSCSSPTRGVFGGGQSGPIFYDTIDYVTIASTGNATDFGDLTYGRLRHSACSTSHGGLS